MAEIPLYMLLHSADGLTGKLGLELEKFINIF